MHEWKAENLGNLLNGMLTYVVVVVVQLWGVEIFTFTQGKVSLSFLCTLGTMY